MNPIFGAVYHRYLLSFVFKDSGSCAIPSGDQFTKLLPGCLKGFGKSPDKRGTCKVWLIGARWDYYCERLTSVFFDHVRPTLNPGIRFFEFLVYRPIRAVLSVPLMTVAAFHVEQLEQFRLRGSV